MAEFKLGRIRFVWKGEWSSGNEYYKDDVVSFNGKSFICVIGHNSSTEFFDDLNAVPSKWNLVADGQSWKGEWQPGERYLVDNIVRYGARLYISTEDHISAEDSTQGLEADIEKWQIFAEGLDWKGNWETSFNYKINDFVKYGGISYVCVQDHISAGTTELGLEEDVSNWQVFNEGFEYLSDWTSGFRYKKNDVVQRGAKLWICLAYHTSSAEFETDSDFWEAFVEGFEFEDEWDATRKYQSGDIVKYGGNQYIAVSDNVSDFPTGDNGQWQLFSEGLRFLGDWNEDSSNVEYRVGEVVRLGGFTYRAVKDHANQQPPNEEFWQRLNSGFEWRGEWLDGAEYFAGDVVRFIDSSFVANSYHIADDGVNSPDVEDSSEFWSVLAIGTEQSVLTTTGDLVYFAGTAPQRLPIGENGQILTVSPEGIPEWEFIGSIEDVYYVTEYGTNEPAPIYGKSLDRPWRSVRYACEQIERGTKNPNARKLLERNRQFIQRETGEWTEYQIQEANSPFTANFTYDSAKYERDIGFIVDAVEYDISHGGNIKTREIALDYLQAAYIEGKENETVAIINYASSLMENVLEQTDPVENYQELRGDNSTRIVNQYKDISLDAEETVYSDIENYVSVINTAILSGSESGIPAREELHTLIRVSTGTYREVCPIIVPAKCCVLGDELRSTRIEARNTVNSTLTPRVDFRYSFEGLDRVEQIIGDVVTGATVTASPANTQSQSQEWPFAETVQVGEQTEKLARSIRKNIDYNIGDLISAKFQTPYSMDAPEFGYGRDLLRLNLEFLKAETIEFINENSPSVKHYSKTKVKNDVSAVIDAVSYDLTYEGNWQSVRIGNSYYDENIATLVIDPAEEQLPIDVYDFLNNLCRDIATGTEVVALQIAVEQITNGPSGTAAVANRINALFTNITDILENGEGTVAIVYPTVDAGTYEETVVSTLDSNISTIQSQAISFINANFSDLVYNQTEYETAIVDIVEALAYDHAVSANVAAIIQTNFYVKSIAGTLNQEEKQARIAVFEFVRRLIIADYIPSGTTVQEQEFGKTVNETFQQQDDAIFTGFAEGNNNQVEDQEVYNAVLQLELNKEFIAQEVLAYVNDYFQDTVTNINTTANTLTISDTSWLFRNQPIEFEDDSTDLTDAGLSSQTEYFVYEITSATEFKIGEVSEGEIQEVDLTQEWNGSFTVKSTYDYNETLCARDVREYIDSIKWDLVYPSVWERSYTGIGSVADFTIYRSASYRHRLAARYYVNSVIGSQEEDMYYLRNATGIRLQSVAGLRGDLTPENEFGTRRPTAGAYCSLDPGWGPEDERVHITARSPYVQNVSTFGEAAIGQKIDGELHAAGNDSIVSNDFTQLISDGIGAWITNNGRAELVSVFSYYAHVGYLAESGGRIRATNGNNSYGTFGSVAEGVDPEETPVRAVVDNRTQFNATVSNVTVDGDQILAVEFDHAGNNYTEAEIEVFGAGIGAETKADEFRDDAVFQARIGATEGVPPGGEGYTVQSNTAQEGSLTGIFLAATDGSLSAAYPGMAIYIVGGSGEGQYAFIDTYNAGSKEATVVKEDGTAGWEHVVPGIPIVEPNSTSVYQIEPRIEFSAPSNSLTTGALDSAVALSAIEYFETSEEYTDVSATGGSGSNVSFDVVRVGSKYYVALNTPGSGYERLETVTIDGTLLGGATPTNDITVTLIALDNSGTVLDFDFDGYGEKGLFVGVDQDSSAIAHTSVDGLTWTTETMATTSPWRDLATGLLDDGSSLYKSAVVAAIAEDGTVNYSADAAVWQSSTSGLPTSGDKKIAFGNIAVDDNRFVAISDNSRDVVYSQNSADSWITTTDALPAIGFSCLTYGKGLFVAARSGEAQIAYSTDGVNWDTTTDVETSGTWTDIKWGNGRFILVSSEGSVLYSLDGITWTDTGLTSIDQPAQIAYGQGVFAITSATENSVVYHSEYGLEWTAQSVDTNVTTGFSAIAHGNPNRTTTFVASSVASDSTLAVANLGAKARGRASVSNEQIFEVRLKEPGSNYSTEPTVTVTDPGNTEDVILLPRIGKGSLANPTFLSRGSNYSEASADINAENSNGEADFRQAVDQIAVKWISDQPVDGSNVEFDSLPGRYFKLVTTVSFVGDNDGSYTAFLQISPGLTITEAPQDEEEITLRIRYSQVRLTGHDFLDIGTGSFSETNYPSRFFGEPVNVPDQANETRSENGGRVFFTSTDQDGNFRVGDLFSVEQSTGVATISADAFNLAGLQELTLGEVSLGGNSAAINEFSTDPFFTADSDNIVPTQRAVKAYIESQIGGGGASLNVNSVTAGNIFIGGNQISSVDGEPINIFGNIRFRGTVLGVPLAFQYFLR